MTARTKAESATKTTSKATPPLSLREREGNRATWPTPDGPWYPITDQKEQRYDHGQDWCEDSGCHPAAQDGYPHDDHGASFCRAVTEWYDVLDGLDATAPLYLTVEGAAPFMFGERWKPSTVREDEARVQFSLMTGDCGELARFSLSLADALLLARQIGWIVDTVSRKR
ncbi:MAG: hypothetical protein EPN43_02200 [Jatrophihabitans sp.]|nr:MAG: hypothetical protein EPN43_02200 [Jatrophihabitans sp.]